MILKQLKYHIPTITLALLLVALTGLSQSTKADDGNYYNFDYEDYWKEYQEWGYPGNSRLPCNGTSESTCTWAWKPWYKHGTSIPRYWAEEYSGRTVAGYAMMMSYYAEDKNLDGGVFRTETVEPCHTYKFTMYARSGLNTEHPTSPNAQMQIGIAPTGFTPPQIILTTSDFDKIVWSETINPQYTYQNLSLQTQALANSIGLFTRADPTTTENQPYFFWDEGSFTEVQPSGDLIDAGDNLPPQSSDIQNIAAYVSTYAAQITWDTLGISTRGQIIYRQVGSGSGGTPSELPNKVYLPLIATFHDWTYSTVASWATEHIVDLTGLKSGTTYEYIIISYGQHDSTCQTVANNTTTPRQFTTP